MLHNSHIINKVTHDCWVTFLFFITVYDETKKAA
jgi:hypothetical protein